MTKGYFDNGAECCEQDDLPQNCAGNGVNSIQLSHLFI